VFTAESTAYSTLRQDAGSIREDCARNLQFSDLDLSDVGCLQRVLWSPACPHLSFRLKFCEVFRSALCDLSSTAAAQFNGGRVFVFFNHETMILWALVVCQVVDFSLKNYEWMLYD